MRKAAASRIFPPLRFKGGWPTPPSCWSAQKPAQADQASRLRVVPKTTGVKEGLGTPRPRPAGGFDVQFVVKQDYAGPVRRLAATPATRFGFWMNHNTDYRKFQFLALAEIVPPLHRTAGRSSPTAHRIWFLDPLALGNRSEVP